MGMDAAGGLVVYPTAAIVVAFVKNDSKLSSQMLSGFDPNSLLSGKCLHGCVR